MLKTGLNSYNFFNHWSENPIFPMGEKRGNNVAYSEVAEERADGSFTIHKYKNYDNGYADIAPINQVSDNSDIKPYWIEDEGSSLDIERGQPISEEVYDSNKILKDRILYAYNDDPNRFSNSIPVLLKNDNSINIIGVNSQRFTARSIFTYYPYLKSKTETMFSGNGQLATKSDYTYDIANKLLTRSSTTSSQGKLLTSINRYPTDMVTLGILNPYQQMIGKNMIGEVIQNEQQVNGVKQSLSFTSYADFGSGAFLPSMVQTQINNNPLQTRSIFTKYDGNGSPLSVSQPGGPSKAYLKWPNSNTYIAEVKNAQYNQIAYTSFENQYEMSSENWSYNSKARTAGLPNEARTGTYFYDFGILPTSQITSNILPAGNYVVSYYSGGDAMSVNGTSPVEVGDASCSPFCFRYYKHVVTLGAAGSISVTCPSTKVPIDELRLYPVGAEMTSYTDDHFSGVTSVAGPDGKVQYYTYDDLDRLNLALNDKKEIIKRYSYNYSQVAYSNPLLTYNFIRSNCAGSGSKGSIVVYTVPAGKYTSIGSNAGAISQANADAAANGPNYANVNGTCWIGTGSYCETTPPPKPNQSVYNNSIFFASGEFICTITRPTSESLYDATVTGHGTGPGTFGSITIGLIRGQTTASTTFGSGTSLNGVQFSIDNVINTDVGTYTGRRIFTTRQQVAPVGGTESNSTGSSDPYFAPVADASCH